MDSAKLSSAGILVVDDEQQNVSLIERLLEREGYTNVIGTTEPNRVVDLFHEASPDLLVLDLHMPFLDGFGVMEALAPHVPADAYFPILVITGDDNAEARHRALSIGAKDFLNKPIDRTEVALRVQSLLQTRFLHMELQVQNVLLEDKVRKRTEGLAQAVTDLERSHEEIRVSQEETVRRLAMAAELRDDDTGQHVHRMSRYVAELADRVGVPIERAELIRLASQMHDVGKIGIPDAVLLKPASLDADERAVIETHSQIGFDILRDSHSELLRTGALIALTHHERFDGGGYPRGLKGNEIPIEGRLASIADVFDALTSDRVYRKAFTVDQAVDIMRQGRGTQFDAELLDAFLGSLDDITAVVRHETQATQAS
ncbi:MAG: HD domain-containing phosphohydrolase [Actinomycetota bacterium]